ncbi:MAG: c-type cytochrome [Deltaproteobacteria bacterium]|nr:c-type cytochrome [Deltaproteobacteria bacterium]
MIIAPLMAILMTLPGEDFAEPSAGTASVTPSRAAPETLEDEPLPSFFDAPEPEVLGPIDLAASVARGERAYRSFCSTCHGILGDGEGPAARWLDPPPRSFVRGEFKWRTTGTGEMPTDDDLLRTVNEGARGTAMPAFANRLPLRMRKDVVQYVKTFSPRFKDPPATPLDIPDPPEVTPELLERGRAAFERVKCWDCHGQEGRGDGPSSSTLVDSLGRPIDAYDFTKGFYKGGASPKAVYRTFLTGLNGTPMPSFATSIREDERWPLVFYTLSLGRERGVLDYLFGSLEEQP